ncbi:hypothetical protein HK100_006191 [Physocladia obscura]|uniref:Steroid 5-alpha reductase C-terminal domain-containing protein n=1 Tax=Physocladia obscura TaxID=109957 RepID=A0AAD5T5H3_9FUNG|nr:hypothetical protein HK100_006191 [Physocladia obscura]
MSLFRSLLKLPDFIMYDGFGGENRKVRPIRYVINSFKGLTLPVMVGLMAYHNNFGWTASVYTSMHGTYGIFWLVKEAICPDPQWQRKQPIECTIMTSAVMLTYWSAGYLTISHHVQVSPCYAASCLFLHTAGIVLMMVTDTQRYFQLKYKKGLISDGWLARSRNTNYLGETMLYSSYFLMSQHWFPWLFPASTMAALFIHGMLRKDESLRKKDGAEEYFKKSWFFFPNFVGAVTDAIWGDNSFAAAKEE